MCIPIASAVIAYLLWNRTVGDIATTVYITANCQYALVHVEAIAADIAATLVSLPRLLASSQPVNLVYTFFILLALGCSCATQLFRNRNQAKTKSSPIFVIGAFIAAIASFSLICLFLLITWNNLEAKNVFSAAEGFQGRYLLPIIYVLLYIQTLWNARSRRPQGAEQRFTHYQACYVISHT